VQRLREAKEQFSIMINDLERTAAGPARRCDCGNKLSVGRILCRTCDAAHDAAAARFDPRRTAAARRGRRREGKIHRADPKFTS
jgi:hypothetical protein